MDLNSTHLTPDLVRAKLLARAQHEKIEATERPRVRVWDKNWNYVAEFYGEISASSARKAYDTGAGSISCYADHPLRKWMTEELNLEEDIHFTIDDQYSRWSGKVATLSVKSNDAGRDILEIGLLDEYEHVKKIICFSNPFLPAEFQFPKLWMYIGPAINGAKSMLFLNLLRRFAPLWTVPENIWQPGSWLSNLDPNNWPIVVKPSDILTDTSMWQVFQTRFGNVHDVLTPMMQDAGVMITYERWLPGDPQPAPSHFHLTRPTLVLDVVDKSGVRGPSGSIFDGLLSFASRIADDGVQEIVEAVNPGNPPADYREHGYFGTRNEFPWVFFESSMRTGLSGISAYEMTIHKPLATVIVTGGKSPGWVNSGIKLMLNFALGYIGMLFGNPSLGIGIFDEYVEDVVLAFHRIPLTFRQMRMGRGQYGEHWEPNNGTGFSLAAIDAFRQGQWKTRAYTSFNVTVRNGAPYWFGKHMVVGDRVAAEIGDSGRLYLDQITEATMSWSRTGSNRRVDHR